MGDVKKLEELDLLEKRLKGKYPTDEELLTFLVSIKHFMVKSGVDCEVKPEMPAPQMTDCLIAQNNTLRASVVDEFCPADPIDLIILIE